MDKPIDLTKPLQTHDGCSVEILKTDFKGTKYPVIAVVTGHNGDQWVAKYTTGGEYYVAKESPMDLINVPQKHTVWVNVYLSGIWLAYETRKEADEKAADDRIACVEVEYEEGEGL